MNRHRFIALGQFRRTALSRQDGLNVGRVNPPAAFVWTDLGRFDYHSPPRCSANRSCEEIIKEDWIRCSG